MKAVKSKAQERLEIQFQINHYLQHGGRVEAVERGISGRDSGTYALPPHSFQEPKESRTPLGEQIRAIEARRGRRAPPKTSRSKRPQRVLLTDDFGEPLRWSWRDA